MVQEDKQENGPAYSERYYDDYFEYRHVSLTSEQSQRLPKPPRVLSEYEWRSLGVQQSRGWAHYAVHRPEPHVLLFRTNAAFVMAERRVPALRITSYGRRRPKYYGTDKEVKVPSHLLRPTENTAAN